MTGWKIVAGPRDGSDPQTELTAATGRRITVRRSQAGDVSLTIDGRHEQAADLTELATDLWCYRDRTLLHRGRLGSSTDNLDADRHSVTLNAPSYRAILERRYLRDGDKLDYVAEDQASIAWQLVQITQGRPGGDLGITRGVGQVSGFLRSRLFTAGQSIASALDSLAEQDTGGQEWDVDAALRLNLYVGRGRDTDVVLDYGGLVSSATRSLTPSDYANAVRGTAAGDPRAPEYREANDVATRPEGRWEAERGFADILEQATLAGATDALLTDAQILRPAYVLTLREGGYPGLAELWIADTVLVRIRSGRLNIADRMRVEEIAFTPGEDGQEGVAVTVGHPHPAGQFISRLRRYDARLAVLERSGGGGGTYV